MKLARQNKDTYEAQQHDGQPGAAVKAVREQILDKGRLCRLLKQRADAAKHMEYHIEAYGKKGEQLDDRLGGNGQHQAVLMLGRVRVPGAEQN